MVNCGFPWLTVSVFPHRAVEVLRCDHAVDAVAVVARFPDDCLDEIADYRQGQGVDALAGVEAVISHLVVERFHIPCAHAPALAPIPMDATIAPRSAAEEVGPTPVPPRRMRSC